MTPPDDDLEAPPDVAVAPPRKRRGLRLSMFPTMLTLGNLVCGVLALAYVADASALFAAGGEASVAAAADKLVRAGWMIVLGMLFDGLDGRVARLTRSTTNFGGQLDSLSDVVTFGVAPALLAKGLVDHTLGSANTRIAFWTAAFYAVCAALRLARYNAEHEEPDQAVTHFKGLPTPGAAGVIAGLAVAHTWMIRTWRPGPEALVVAGDVVRFGVLVGLGLLMVSKVPYAHFANRFLSGKRPIGRVALVILLVILMIELDSPALVVAGAFMAYALSGPIGVIPRLIRGKTREVAPELFE